VIALVWRGWAPADGATQYERHYRCEVLPGLRGEARFEGARLLLRTTGDETEFVSVTFFDDLDAVRAFAEPDDETAVVMDEARECLGRFDDRAGHYETALEAS
jgi:heme-degrading monooxygenase HmoA